MMDYGAMARGRKSDRRPVIVKYGDRQVRLYEKLSGKWLLQWKEVGGWKNTTRASEKDARDAAREIAMRLATEPQAPAMITQEQRRMLNAVLELGGWQWLDDAREATRLLEGQGQGSRPVSLTSALRYWAENAPPAAVPMPVGEAYKRFLAEVGRTLSRSSRENLEYALAPLARDFESVLVSELTARALSEWLEGMAQAGNWSALTWNIKRTRIQRFFRWCTHPRQGYLPAGRPTAADLLESKKAPEPIPPVLAPEVFDQILGLLEERYVPYAAVCAFAGLRALSEAAALRWEHFDWQAGHLYVDLSVARKTQRERFVPLEPNLVEILLPFRKTGGPLVAGWGGERPDQALARVIKALGVVETWPSRILRHTYISSRIARGDPIGLVAEHAGNSEAVSRKRYRRAMTREQGEAWFRIVRGGGGEKKVVKMP